MRCLESIIGTDTSTLSHTAPHASCYSCWTISSTSPHRILIVLCMIRPHITLGNSLRRLNSNSPLKAPRYRPNNPQGFLGYFLSLTKGLPQHMMESSNTCPQGSQWPASQPLNFSVQVQWVMSCTGSPNLRSCLPYSLCLPQSIWCMTNTFLDCKYLLMIEEYKPSPFKTTTTTKHSSNRWVSYIMDQMMSQ